MLSSQPSPGVAMPPSSHCSPQIGLSVAVAADDAQLDLAIVAEQASSVHRVTVIALFARLYGMAVAADLDVRQRGVATVTVVDGVAVVALLPASHVDRTVAADVTDLVLAIGRATVA